MGDTQEPLWICPRCGHGFVTANLWHSCSSYALDDHFAGKDPLVRAVFERLAGVIAGFGLVTVYAQKTRIVFMVRVRFVAARPHKHWLDGHIWLKRRADDPHFYKIEKLPPSNYIHNFRLTDPEQIDDAFTELLRDSYRVGCQEIR